VRIDIKLIPDGQPKSGMYKATAYRLQRSMNENYVLACVYAPTYEEAEAKLAAKLLRDVVVSE
jgi:hypothetical protein